MIAFAFLGKGAFQLGDNAQHDFVSAPADRDQTAIAVSTGNLGYPR